MYTKIAGVRNPKYPIFGFSELFDDNDCGEECLRSMKNIKGDSLCVNKYSDINIKITVYGSNTK
jgi:hypothetical protein